MVTRLTLEVLEGTIKCRLKGSLKLAGEHGKATDYELLMAETRQIVRQKAIECLLNRYKRSEVLRGEFATPAFLQRGASLILDTTLLMDDLAVQCDALIRTEGPSRLGQFHYTPALFHEVERPSKEQRILLACLSLVVGSVQEIEPRRVLLFHGRHCLMRRVTLGAEFEQARLILNDVKEAERSGTRPRLILNTHCQACEFRQRCDSDARTKDDLSLLGGVGQKEIERYARRGIFTVTQLSYTFRARKRYKAGQRFRPRQHALKALAIREQRVYVMGEPDLPTSPNRIYFDIEGDPERGFDYLLGMIVVANGVEEHYAFWVDDPASEAQLLIQLLDVVVRHSDATLFCYGAYEAAFLRRISKALKRPDLEGTLLPRLVNVLGIIHAHVFFPTYSNGLKDVGSFLGCAWTAADASGLQSIVWRRRWEESSTETFKEMLKVYNLEDCAALKRVTEFLYASFPDRAGRRPGLNAGIAISQVEEFHPDSARPNWGDVTFALPDFSFVNERAYFDYQRDKVSVRNSKASRRHRRQRVSRWKRNRRVNRELEMSSQFCPGCGGSDLTRQPQRSLARLAFDLRFTRGGIKKWISRYRTTWHHCAECGRRFLPGEYLRLREFCHSLMSWAMYEHVAHRTSMPNIADTIRESFNMPMCHTQVSDMKGMLADYYRGSYERLMEKIKSGTVMHVDETEVHVRRLGKGYIWVFTNLEEVVYLYRRSREGDFLHDFTKGFQGVLVSDFYAAYDSLPCAQQKCLVHLVRDFNQDLLRNPWDEELKQVASSFGSILRTLVATIDKWGLRRCRLAKHRQVVDGFFTYLEAAAFDSETAQRYRQRLLKYREKLFTFIFHDCVAWNNNNAEHAVKAFAQYRAIADNRLTETGLNQYLVLLSVYQTCKYKNLSFLRFLLSGETDIDTFSAHRGRRVLEEIELYPVGATCKRPSRHRLVDPA